MPRRARVIEPNGFYHIISRSTNEVWILKDDNDFNYFLALEQESKKQFPIRLFHYVLMNTHFHFVLQTRDKETLSQHMAFLKWHYTKWIRRKYGWRGPLWRERYKSLPIEDEAYLTTCGAYVEYNPVRAGICKDPGEYLFSSYRKYHLNGRDSLLDEYESEPPPKAFKDLKLEGSLSRKIFSRSPAIGSPVFVQRHRSS